MKPDKAQAGAASQAAPSLAGRQRVLLIGGTGYIGSRLYHFLQLAEFEVDTVDLELRGNRVNPDNQKIDFQYLTAAFLSDYSDIILLAGHSNVAQSVRDPYGAFENNLVKFTGLLAKLNGQKLVYASSSSIYTGIGGKIVDENWQTFNFMNMYDFSKYACDAISKMLYQNFYALRFGTVCGPSENLRLDLMINRMVWSAVTRGKIQMANPEIRRPILGIGDLCRAVELILRGKDDPGIYNLASFNTTVGDVAAEVSAILGCEIERLPDSPTYDFSMKNKKIALSYGFQPTESVATIVDDLLRFHEQRDLRSFA